MVLIAWQLFLAELKRGFLEWVRYPIQPIAGLVFILCIFVAVFYGANALPMFRNTGGVNLTKLVITFFCWEVTVFAVGQAAGRIEHDAERGTLEGLFTSKLRPSTIILVRIFVGASKGMIFALASLAMILLYTGAHLSVGVIAIIALVIFNVALSGIGVVLAGLCVVAKRFTLLLPIAYLAIGVLVTAAVSSSQGSNWIWFPVYSNVVLLSEVISGRAVSITQFATTALWAPVTLIAGLYCFERLVNVARRRGTLAHS